MKEKIARFEDRMITSDLTIPTGARAIAVLGFHSGAGVSTTADYIRSRTGYRSPPPIVMDRGHIPQDKADMLAKLQLHLIDPPADGPATILADVLVLLRHEWDQPSGQWPVLQMVDEIYAEAKQNPPHIICRYKGLADYPDAVMASKAEMTDKLLWLMAKAFFKADGPDFHLAKEVFDGDRQDSEIEESNKTNTNKL